MNRREARNTIVRHWARRRTCCWCLGAVLLVFRGQAQDLSGVWQGVEVHPPMSNDWPALLTLNNGTGSTLTGVLYQELGNRPTATGTFEMRGTQTAGGLQLDYARVVAETNMDGGSWCLGTVAFTYDAALERLSGRSTFRPVGNCSTSSFELYRVRLKSAPTVAMGSPSTLRVSGRAVRWFADPGLRQHLATGNTYRTTLTKATVFYVIQDFYPNARRQVIPVAVGVRPPRPRALPTARFGPASQAPPPAPLVLPTVLFRLGTAELLPGAFLALDELAAKLQARPALHLRILGHTDRIGEATKNLLLSEQRARAVLAYLAQAGIAPVRLSAIGFGDTKLRYHTPDPRNRRVEVEVIK